MSNYNYNQKLEYRNNLLNNIKLNSNNIQNLDMKEWYQTYMPFLPKGKSNFLIE
jgi:hypothetical protein